MKNIFSEGYLNTIDKLYNDSFNEKDRVDLTFIPFISIDNSEAITLEDIIFVLPNNDKKTWTVFIGIIDITSFIQRNSEVELIAIEKPNSSKMIPSEIKGKYGSFKADKKQLALVMQAEINTKGELLNIDFFKAVCKVKESLTFKDADNIFNNIDRQKYDPVSIHTIKTLSSITHLIRKSGSNFNKSWFSFSIDSKSKGIQKIASEEIVKTFMTIANVCAAEFIKKYSKYAYITNIPDSVEKTYNIKFSEASNIKFEKGGVLKYCNFTLPLRRFSGMIVHRIIKSVFDPNYKRIYTKEELQRLDGEIRKREKNRLR